MKISTRTRYGMRAMVDLAMHLDSVVLLKDISRHQEISLKYLGRIMSDLKSAGLIKNMRGKDGGYKLIRSPDEIYVSEIYRALEGGMFSLECIDEARVCKRSKNCVLRMLWKEVKMSLEKTLNVKLSELAEKQRRALTKENRIYYI